MSNHKSRALGYKTRRDKETKLPSGESVLLRKVPLQAWWGEGRLPQAFISAAMEVQAANSEEPTSPPPPKTDEQKQAERQELAKFMLAVVKFAFVSPCIVDTLSDDEEADEITVEEVAPEDFNFVFAYATHQLPDSKIATKEGEVTVSAVADFHPSGQHEPPAIASNDVPEVRGATV